MKLWQKISTGLITAGLAASAALIPTNPGDPEGRIYRDPPGKGIHEIAIGQIEAEARHYYKSDVLSRALTTNVTPPIEGVIGAFGRDGISVFITELSTENDLLKVVAWATECKIVVDDICTDRLKVNNPLFYKNPPLKVGNGTYHKELNDETGEEYDVENMVEDPQAALKEIIIQTIKLYNNL